MSSGILIGATVAIAVAIVLLYLGALWAVKQKNRRDWD